MLEEKLKSKLENLEKVLEEMKVSDNNISNSELEELQSFAEKVLEDIYNISQYENVDNYIRTIYQNEEPNIIKTYADAIIDMQKNAIKHRENDPFNIYEISGSRADFIKKVCDDIKIFVIQTKEKIAKQEKDILEKNQYQEILNKLNSGENMSEDDLNLIQVMIQKDPISERITVLKEIFNHNINIEKNKTELAETEEQVQSLDFEEEIKNPIVDKKEIFEIIDNYELDNKKDCKDTVEEHEEEILKYADKENIKAILNYLIIHDLYKNFENTDNLFAILLYGTVDTVKAAHEDLEYNNIINDDFIYKMPSLWVDQEKAKHYLKIKKPKDGNTHTKAMLKNAISGLIREEIYEIIKICNEEGTKYDKKSIFRQRPDVVSFAFRVFKKYGIPIKASMLSNSKQNSVAKCDMAIECDLFSPHAIGESHGLSTYCNGNPTVINGLEPGHALYLETQHQDGISNDLIESAIRSKRNFKDEFFHICDGFLRLNEEPFKQLKSKKGKRTKSQENRQAYAEKNDMTSLVFNNDLENYEKMEIAINTPDYIKLETDKNILDSAFIKQLDEQYSVPNADYLYIIDGVRISRYKVLRLYQSLKEYNLDHPNDTFDENSMRLFSIAYGTYFKNDIYNKMKNDINAKSIQGGAR